MLNSRRKSKKRQRQLLKDNEEEAEQLSLFDERELTRRHQRESSLRKGRRKNKNRREQRRSPRRPRKSQFKKLKMTPLPRTLSLVKVSSLTSRMSKRSVKVKARYLLEQL